MKTTFSKRKNQSGFIVADFLFSFILVLGVGFLLFALSFSLAAIEVAQYLVWSSARAHASADKTEAQSRINATNKFENLALAFPLLTGRGATGTPWVSMSAPLIGNLADIDQDFKSKVSSGADLANRTGNGQIRQPWIGVKSDVNLELFSKVQFPFIGPITNDPSKFKFPVRAFLLRHPSQEECKKFYSDRYQKGIKKLGDVEGSLFSGIQTDDSKYVPIEDNGC